MKKRGLFARLPHGGWGEMQEELLLIRTVPEIGGGWCGGLTGDGFISMKQTFHHTRSERKKAGEVYRAVQKAFPEMTIHCLDPRNGVAICAYFFRHWKRKHVGIKELALTAASGIFPGAVFYNGMLINQKADVSPKEIVNLLQHARRQEGARRQWVEWNGLLKNGWNGMTKC